MKVGRKVAYLRTRNYRILKSERPFDHNVEASASVERSGNDPLNFTRCIENNLAIALNSKVETVIRFLLDFEFWYRDLPTEGKLFMLDSNERFDRDCFR